MTTVRAGPGEPRGAWLAALTAPGALEGAEVLKREGEDWVAAATLRVAGVDRRVVVKRRRGRGVVEGIKTLAGAGRLMRQWRGSTWLAARGIATARPLALLRRWGPSCGEEVLVMERLEGPSLLECLASRGLTRGQERALAEEVGRMAARMVAAGRYNRDHKPSNLIVTGVDERSATVAVIDAVAIRVSVGGLRGLERMLASLVIEPTGCGHPPTAWEMRRVVRAAAGELVARVPTFRGREGARVGALARVLWRAAAEVVEGHGDPTPRVDPLVGVGGKEGGG